MAHQRLHSFPVCIRAYRARGQLLPGRVREKVSNQRMSLEPDQFEIKVQMGVWLLLLIWHGALDDN